MKVTQFGLIIRRSRLERGISLKDMANELEITSSFLSAVELGKKKISDDLIGDVANFFSFGMNEKNELKEAAENSQPVAKIDLVNDSPENKQLAHMFARKFRDMTDEEKERLKEILS